MKAAANFWRAILFCAAGLLFCAAAQAQQEKPPRSGILQSDLSKARDLQERGDWRALQIHASRWSHVEPKEWRAWRFLGEAERALGRLEQAMEAFRRAEDARPSLRGGGRDEDDDTLLVAVADLEAQDGRLLEAENSYLKALRKKPDNKDTWRKLSDLRVKLAEGDPLRVAKAADTLATVMSFQININDYERWRKYAELLDALERSEPAKEAYQNAVRLRPADGLARERIILIDLNAGRKQEALSGMRDLLRVDPGNVVANAYLGEKQLAEGFVDEAKEHFRRVAAAQAGDEEARVTAYSHLIELAETRAEKVELHKQALRVRPTLWDSWDYVIVQTRGSGGSSGRDAAEGLLRRKSTARHLAGQGKPVPPELLP